MPNTHAYPRRYPVPATAAIPALDGDQTASPAGDLDAELQHLFNWVEEEEDDDPEVLTQAPLCYKF
jgi:hypothetical protein